LTTFLDTSALLALLDEDDLNHSRADEAWRQLLGSDEPLVSTNYIVVETLALVQRRLGMEAAKALERDLLPLLDLEWINEATHRSALRTFLSLTTPTQLRRLLELRGDEEARGLAGLRFRPTLRRAGI
jgi:predicted nucleic acid-binding protein